MASPPNPRLTTPTLKENPMTHETNDKLVEIIEQNQEIHAAATALAMAPTETRGAAALPDHFRVRDLEHYLPHRRRMAGMFETRSVAPFAQYAAQHADAGATVFVDADNMTAMAVLDLGTTEAPGHADNCAKLAPRKTAAYRALQGIAHTARSQKAIAEFFEDWNGIARLQFFAEDTPDGQGEEIPLRRAIAALRAVDIKTTTGMEGRVEQLSSSLSAFEQVKASSKDTLPATIYFTCQPYADLAERTFVLRLSVSAGEKGPTLILHVKNEERHIEEMAEELAELVAQAVTAAAPEHAIPVLRGTYDKR